MSVFGRPPFFHEQTKVFIGKSCFSIRPGTPESTGIRMATPHGMGPQEGDHFLRRQSHSSKDLFDMVQGGFARSHIGIGQTILGIRFAPIDVIDPTQGKGNLGPTRFFDCHDTGQGIQVSIGKSGMLGLDGLQEGPGLVQAGIVPILGFGSKSHFCSIASSTVVRLLIGPTRMPCQTNQRPSDTRPIVTLFSIFLHQLNDRGTNQRFQSGGCYLLLGMNLCRKGQEAKGRH